MCHNTLFFIEKGIKIAIMFNLNQLGCLYCTDLSERFFVKDFDRIIGKSRKDLKNCTIVTADKYNFIIF